MNAPLCQTHYIQVYDLEGTAILGLSRKHISMETSSIIGGQHEHPGFCSSSFLFFFLHCRASAKHSRSTTGNMK